MDAMSSNSMKSSNPHSGIHETEVTKCLDTMCLDPGCNQGGCMVCIALEGNGARPSHLGKGFSEDGTMYTLNTIELHSVCYSIDCRNLNMSEEKSGTLQAKSNGGFSYNYLNPVLVDKQKTDVSVYAVDSHPGDSRISIAGETAPTITVKTAKASSDGPLVLIRHGDYP